MKLTNKQIDKIGRILGCNRDGPESRELWNIRVLGGIEDAWDRLNALEREAAEEKRVLRLVFGVLGLKAQTD